MTDRELLQMALDALEAALSDDQPYISRSKEIVEALRARLAQPEQEPCIHVNNPKGCYRVRCQLGNKCVNDDMSFRTTPPQREVYCGCGDEIVAGDGARCGTCVAVKYKERVWVGLTDSEKKDICQEAANEDWTDLDVINATEAKLKDKT